MLIISGRLYLFGMFDDAFYTSDARVPHFLFKTDLALSLDPLCSTTKIKVTASSVSFVNNYDPNKGSADTPGLTLSDPSLNINPGSDSSSSAAIADVCFNDVAPFTLSP